MRIPKQLKVAGHIYKVKYPYIFREDPNLQGQSDLILKEIRLSDVTKSGAKIPMALVMNCLCHEILHCVDYEYNNQSLEEDAVMRLANGLYQVLRDNRLHFDE